MSTLRVKFWNRPHDTGIALLRVAKRAGFGKFERAGLNYPCPDCKGAGYQLVNVKIAFTQNTESHSHGCCRVGDSSFHQQLFDPLVELFERDCAFDPLGINEEGRRRIDLQHLVGEVFIGG